MMSDGKTSMQRMNIEKRILDLHHYTITPPKNEILKSGSEQWFTYWEAGWVLLISALNDSGNIHKLLINEVYWSNMTIGNDNYLPHYSSAGIHAAVLYGRATGAGGGSVSRWSWRPEGHWR